jgi:hypothetical protein
MYLNFLVFDCIFHGREDIEAQKIQKQAQNLTIQQFLELIFTGCQKYHSKMLMIKNDFIL